MRCVLITALGWPVEPEVKRNLAMVSGEQRRLAAAERVARHHELDRVRHGGGERAGERPAVIGEHEARSQQVEDHAQLAEVGRQQRIGRRDRRVWDADMHRRQRQQRVLDVVAGQNDDRPFRRQPALQERRADAAHLVQHLRVTEGAPAAIGVTLRQERAIRRRFRPMLERLAQRAVIGRQHLRGADVNDAAGFAFKHGIRRAEPHRAQRRRCALLRLSDRLGHRQVCVAFGARFSRNALSRCLASGSAWAIADISASTT